VSENFGQEHAHVQDQPVATHPEGMDEQKQGGLVDTRRVSNPTNYQSEQLSFPNTAVEAMLNSDTLAPNFMQSQAPREASRVHGQSPLDGMRESMMSYSYLDSNSLLRSDFVEHGRVLTMPPVQHYTEDSLGKNYGSQQPEGFDPHLRPRSREEIQGHNISKFRDPMSNIPQEKLTQLSLPYASPQITRGSLGKNDRSQQAEGVNAHLMARSREEHYGYNISNLHSLSPSSSREILEIHDGQNRHRGSLSDFLGKNDGSLQPEGFGSHFMARLEEETRSRNILNSQGLSPSIAQETFRDVAAHVASPVKIMGNLGINDRSQQRHAIDPRVMAHLRALELPYNIPNFHALTTRSSHSNPIYAEKTPFFPLLDSGSLGINERSQQPVGQFQQLTPHSRAMNYYAYPPEFQAEIRNSSRANSIYAEKTPFSPLSNSEGLGINERSQQPVGQFQQLTPRSKAMDYDVYSPEFQAQLHNSSRPNSVYAEEMRYFPEITREMVGRMDGSLQPSVDRRQVMAHSRALIDSYNAANVSNWTPRSVRSSTIFAEETHTNPYMDMVTQDADVVTSLSPEPQELETQVRARLEAGNATPNSPEWHKTRTTATSSSPICAEETRLFSGTEGTEEMLGKNSLSQEREAFGLQARAHSKGEDISYNTSNLQPISMRSPLTTRTSALQERLVQSTTKREYGEVAGSQQHLTKLIAKWLVRSLRVRQT
jgi:hypothetical protein